MTGGKQNPKLATARPPLDLTRVGRLANFLCFSLMRGIRLGSFELVIMKGGGRRIATATSRDMAPTEVTQPQPDRVRQHEDMAARVRAGGALGSARWSQEVCQCAEHLNAVASPERLTSVG